MLGLLAPVNDITVFSEQNNEFSAFSDTKFVSKLQRNQNVQTWLRLALGYWFYHGDYFLLHTFHLSHFEIDYIFTNYL